MEDLLNPALAETRVLFGMAEAEHAAGQIARMTAAQMRAIVNVLAEARHDPEVFLDDAALQMLGPADRVDYAQRAAVADLATRIGMAEGTVWAYAHQAEALIGRLPRVWALFGEGEISAPNARLLADRSGDVAPEAWYDLDLEAVKIASLSPARFATRLRGIVERLATEPLTVRHRRRVEERRVCVEPDRDGMSWLSIYAPDTQVTQVMAHLDAIATTLDTGEETRTRDQLRADTAIGLLAQTSGGMPAVRATVHVTVPVMTLLGGDDPGLLDGVTPIDADTARRLAGGATSFHRILTHPITSAILDYDRTTYRVPADLQRAVAAQHPVCVFPGCGHRTTDLDHTTAWADGGTTTAANLRPLCRHHHRLKHLTRWAYHPTDTGADWTSPTGNVHRSNDPPPPF